MLKVAGACHRGAHRRRGCGSAWVRNRPVDIARGTGIHPSGVTGVSVECAVGLSVATLAIANPHSQLGVTTVGAVRREGEDVVRTTG